MSTRWYPIWQKGNPQLRVFLPNFWMKIVKPEHRQPKHVVTFNVSMEMTVHDVRNYLRQIYNLPVIDVRTRIALGPTEADKTQGYIKKADDYKLAYVIFPRDVKFEFPDIFPSDSETKKQLREDEKPLEESKGTFRKFLSRSKNRRGLPGWYSI
ncbi:CLUMA_CG011977, isoform A [Clunio marinus]|uniref:Large ribosomal subunit protein uL23m n=1 Tax=Clunio marinus TaxID=568069 RepID=A0A1J1IHC0_9DIPT|nr:CLUMA_CG011977, isoform A [Clunio marinus]